MSQVESVTTTAPCLESTPIKPAPDPVQTHLCPECGNMYKYARNMIKHLRIVHSSLGGSSFKCHSCNKQFRCNNDLEAHTNKHLNIKPFECSKCKKSFYNKRFLAVHSCKEKKYHCQFCFKQCTTAALFRQHMLSHEINPSFRCLKCRRSFKHRQSFKRHEEGRCPLENM